MSANHAGGTYGLSGMYHAFIQCQEPDKAGLWDALADIKMKIRSVNLTIITTAIHFVHLGSRTDPEVLYFYYLL